MTYQEILEGITKHRANSLLGSTILADKDFKREVQRKCDEIEWALQAIALKLSDAEQEKTDERT